jgi:hypothetical protein
MNIQHSERLISVFKKADESLFMEINIDHLNLEDLRDIFKPPPEDHDLIYVYPISLAEADRLKEILDIDFNFNEYIYQLDCFVKQS